MWLILSLVLAAQYKGGLSAPVGAPPLEDDDDFLHSFSLFHPSLVTPAAEQPDAVPVIHLPVTGGDMRKVSAEHYLDLFPPDLRPVDVKIIEHEDFIDYEVEFAKLPEKDKNNDVLSLLDSSKQHLSTRTKPENVDPMHQTKNSTDISSFTVNTFANLLNTARQHLRNKTPTEIITTPGSEKSQEIYDRQIMSDSQLANINDNAVTTEKNIEGVPIIPSDKSDPPEMTPLSSVTPPTSVAKKKIIGPLTRIRSSRYKCQGER